LSKVRQLASHTAIYGVSTILGRLLNYLLVPLHTYLFEPSSYGVVGELYAYITFLNIVYLLGMETGFFHFANHRADSQRVYASAFFTLTTASILFSGTALLLNKPLATLLAYPDHPEYIAAIAGILALDTIAAIPFARLRLQEKALTFSIVKVSNIGINIAFNLFWLLLCPWILKQPGLSGIHYLVEAVYDPSIGVGYVFFANLMASGLTLVFLLPQLKAFRWEVDFKLIKQMLVYALPLVAVGVAGMVNETIDRILLRHWLPYDTETNLAKVGVYSACYKLSIFMTLVVQAFRYAAEPLFFAESKKSDNPGRFYADVMTVFVAFGGLIFLGVTGYLNLLKYLIDPAYHTGLHVVPILLLANLFLGMYFNLSIWYKLTERNQMGAVIAFIGAGVTILLNLLLIPDIGYTGSALATLASYGVMVGISYGLSRKYYAIPYDLKKISFYISLAIAFFAVGWVFEHKVLASWGWASILLKTGLIGIYAGIFAYLEKPHIMLNLLRKIRSRF
jgi:O-antigen/teichoic acid export membrane protein